MILKKTKKQNLIKENYAEARRLAMLLTVWQIPNIVTNLAAALANRSMVLWMEFIETLTIVLPALLLVAVVLFLRKDLKYQFNYGTGKIEAFTALIIEIFDIGGLLLIIILSIMNLAHAQEEYKSLLFAIVMEAIGVVVTAVIQFRLKRIIERRNNKIAETFYISIRKELFFGIISMVTLVVSIFDKHTFWSLYLSPIVCLVLTVPFFIMVCHHILFSARDLLDETLEEDLQLKILKILSEFFEEYTEIGDVRSRRSGEIIFIEIPLVFDEHRTFGEIQGVCRRMENRLKEEIGPCDVDIVIQ